MVRDESTAFALRVRGDALRAEQIRDGDLLVLERRADAAPGQTVLLFEEGAAALRSVDGATRHSVETGATRIAGVLVGVIRTC